MKAVVELRKVGMNYQSPNGEIKALENVDFTVDDGEFVCIVGPSGCGKSTLLSIIAGLLIPSSGEVFLYGEQFSGPSRKTGYMLQRDHLFEWRTILENILLGLEIQKILTPQTKEKALAFLETYGLYEFRGKYPNQLSGGMRQRAALVRTLMTDPRILLLDEAFSALDYQTRLAVSDDIYAIIKKEKKTAILVTHDISEAISMADRVIVLSHRPGTVKKIHQISLTCHKRTPLVSREAPEFRYYFQEIWEELDVHV
ncbi:MAG: ABC transporter ATP-binding protein [Syntrophomonadaceae bacterium]|nr:ABC transporter ATP-binding protein [Syntrophomonadaceae bacterium]